MFKKEYYLLESGKLQAYAWPGGYPLYYLTADNGVLCPDCASLPECTWDSGEDEQWDIVAAGGNWEDDSLYCDHCGKQIESAYGEDGKNDLD